MKEISVTQEDIPRVVLVPEKSPLEPLPRLSDHLGNFRLYVKRDDEGGRGGGGNKLRKFERQLAEAVLKKADTLVIAGHPQSNAARELAGTAARFGLKCVVVSKKLIKRDRPELTTNGNALLLNLLGAQLVEIGPDKDFAEALQETDEMLKREGRRPFVLPFGASNLLGNLGYAECAKEIVSQMIEVDGQVPDYIYNAVGSCGTMAGLVAGLSIIGVHTKVIGISILQPAAVAKSKIEQQAKEILQRLGKSNLTLNEFDIDDRFIGEGYGIPTLQGMKAIRLMAELEGLFLCPVYTGKAMAGLLATVNEKCTPASSIVFLHTGGLPLLFPYAMDFN